ncbi:MAG TPA: DUF4349 domain-containing protein [Pyrinomonadaceae bacterium]|nr:DUF4349 domain-containing protein [Pyrinomonadaceae bacterium]
MRLTVLSLAAAVVLTFSACGGAQYKDRVVSTTNFRSDAPGPAVVQNAQQRGAATDDVALEKASYAAQEATAEPSLSIERKIIRNAELAIESRNPEESFRKVASLAESKGGFVVTSEAVQPDGAAEPERMNVTVVVRVPAAQFETTVEEIRRLGSRVLRDNRTGQDVTEEYIDLQARLQAKRALESQFLEIMKQAKAVSEALEVQRQLAEVRSEIEQIEGRRRFLENQSNLSTIRVSVVPPVQIIGRSGGGFKEALRDGFGAAMLIVMTLVRVVLALLPILILIGLPAWLILRYWLRRNKRPRVNGTPVA